MPFNDESRAPIKIDNLQLGIVAEDETNAEVLDAFLDEGEEAQPITKKPPVKKPVPPKKTTTPIPPKKKEEEPEEEEEEDNTREKLEKLLNDGAGGEESGEENEEESSNEEEGQENEEEGAEGSGKKEEEEDNTFKSLSKDLVNLGIFTLNEGETDLNIETPEQFQERWLLEKQKGANDVLERFLSRFGDDYFDMFQAVFMSGVDPTTYLQGYARIDDLASLDLSNELNQERVIREKLSLDGFTPEEMGKEIERLKGYNELEEKANIYHRVLLKNEQEAQEETERASRERLVRLSQKKQEYNQRVNQILTDKIAKKEFDGIPVDPKTAQELQAYLTKDAYTVNGKTITQFDKELLDLDRPENYELKVKMAMLLKMVKADPTLSKIKKKAVSNEGNALFQQLRSKNKDVKSTEGKTKTKIEENNRWF